MRYWRSTGDVVDDQAQNGGGIDLFDPKMSQKKKPKNIGYTDKNEQ